MKDLIIFLCCIFFSSASMGQQFIRSGKIIYERKVNLWANMDKEFTDEDRKAVPQYETDKFSFTFGDSQSLYKAESEIKTRLYNITARDNIVYTDFRKDQYISSKNLFENALLVSDSLSKIRWKIKDDFRDIAGFTCRRATALLFDSVFVVAFYTDEITIPGGPESFHGLPGTILGLVINRLHTTWYATHVEIDNIDKKKIVPPSKGVKVNYQEIIKRILAVPLEQQDAIQKLYWIMMI